MSLLKFFRVGASAAIVSLGLGALAMAQTSKSADPSPIAKPEAQRPVDAEPNSTSARFGDWVLRCQRIGDGATIQRVCEVSLQIRAQGRQDPVAELAIGHLKKSDPLRLTLALPVNASFPNPPVFSANSNELDQLDLGWRKCVPGNCFADAPLKDNMLSRWRTQTSAGRVTWRDAEGRDSTIGVSFRGLTQALDALSREP